jgi:hypothetical protein
VAIDGKPNAKGRSSGKPNSKAHRYINPPSDELWLHVTHDFLRSPAVMALSHNAMKVLWRLMDEHVSHNRRENGLLRVSQHQFADQCDIRYQSVPRAMRELEAVGITRVARTGKMLGMDGPNLHRLTMYGDHTLTTPPTNEWKRYRTIAEARKRILEHENRYLREHGKCPTPAKQRKAAIEASENVTELDRSKSPPQRGDI